MAEDTPNEAKASDPTRARAALLDVIEKQIANNDPPETKRTLERLLGMGYTREGCMKFIASALIGELFGALKGQANYDAKRYIANLKALPKLPWEKE